MRSAGWLPTNARNTSAEQSIRAAHGAAARRRETGGTAETPQACCDFGLSVCPGQWGIKRQPETAEMRVVVLITQRPPDGGL